MNIELKKEGSKKSLNVKDIGIKETDFKMQMLLNNRINGLLPIKINSVNNKKELVYDITGLVCIGSMFDRKRMGKDDLIKVTKSLKELSSELRKYLLNIEDICLDTEKVYYNKSNGKYYFCYVPENDEDLIIKLKDFYSQLLDYVDYNDEEAVRVAYGMQRITSEDDFSIEDIFRFGYGSECVEESEPVEEEELIEDLELDDETLESEEPDEKQSFLKGLWEKLFKREKKFKTEDTIDDYELEIASNSIEPSEKIVEPIDRCIEPIANVVEPIEKSFEPVNIAMEENDATMLLVADNMGSNFILKSTNVDNQIIVFVDHTPYKIGKNKKNDFVLDEDTISREHIAIIKEGLRYYVEDLRSTNGTFVNGKKLSGFERMELSSGDKLTLAGIEFEVM